MVPQNTHTLTHPHTDPLPFWGGGIARPLGGEGLGCGGLAGLAPPNSKDRLASAGENLAQIRPRVGGVCRPSVKSDAVQPDRPLWGCPSGCVAVGSCRVKS